MSDLPPPLPIFTTQSNSTQQTLNRQYDLTSMHKAFQQEFQRLENIADEMFENLPKGFIDPTREACRLIDRDLWRIDGVTIAYKYLGFSSKYESLTVSLFDEKEEVKAICIRRATDREGNAIKWKTYGSKRFIPYRIFDEADRTLFVGYGIAEMLLFELLEYNYMILQSDSIAHNLSSNPYAPQIEDRYIFALLDNDESCKATLEPLQKHYADCRVYGIDFENLHDRGLPKGYDFRDFCNEVAKEVRGDRYLADPEAVRKRITLYLANEIKTILGAR